MLTKTDAKVIKNLLQSELKPLKSDLSVVKQDVSGLKQDVSSLKQDVSIIKQDVSVLKHDVSGLKQDISTIKEDIDGMKIKLNEFASLMLSAITSILGWTQDIHESIVKEKLPQRVKKIEQLIKTS